MWKKINYLFKIRSKALCKGCNYVALYWVYLFLNTRKYIAISRCCRLALRDVSKPNIYQDIHFCLMHFQPAFRWCLLFFSLYTWIFLCIHDSSILQQMEMTCPTNRVHWSLTEGQLWLPWAACVSTGSKLPCFIESLLSTCKLNLEPNELQWMALIMGNDRAPLMTLLFTI